MFQRPTTIIVGAGSSCEYNLPIGEGLKEEIAASLSRLGQSDDHGGILIQHDQGADQVLARAVEIAGRSNGLAWKRQAQAMWQGVLKAPSIDQYLNLHRANDQVVQIGKIAVARAILAAEQGSFLGQTSVNARHIKDSLKGEPNWLHELFLRLQQDVSLENIHEMFSNLSIVTFNYDRTIEHFIYNYLIDLTGFHPGKIAEVMNSLTIVHPYGTIGRLPWQPDDWTPALPFGHYDGLRSEAIVSAGERLRTFTETVDDEAILDSIHKAVSECQTLVFLGFGYLKQNIDLLTPKRKPSVRRVEGTVFGMSDHDVAIVENRILRMLAPDPQNGVPFKMHWRKMASGRLMADLGNSLIS